MTNVTAETRMSSKDKGRVLTSHHPGRDVVDVPDRALHQDGRLCGR